MGELIPKNAVRVLAMCEIVREQCHLVDGIPLHADDGFYEFVMRQSIKLKERFGELFDGFMDPSKFDSDFKSMSEREFYDLAEDGALFLFNRDLQEKLRCQFREIKDTLPESEE